VSAARNQSAENRRIGPRDGIAARMRLGSVNYEAQPNAKGEQLIWLEPAVLDKHAAPRGPGESFSEVILES
jgi:hypothetical protein